MHCSSDPCHLGPLRGPCQAYVQRWFYSAEEDQCRDFLYGGCGGNEYSFETRESCEQTCRTHADFGNRQHFVVSEYASELGALPASLRWKKSDIASHLGLAVKHRLCTALYHFRLIALVVECEILYCCL